jgi:hypothetical protein
MLAPPKPLIGLGARILTYRVARWLRRYAAGPAEQQRTFRKLLPQLANTVFGRQHGLTAHLTYQQWQERVLPRRYEQFAPYVKRMEAGEAHVLWPGCCTLFAATAATSGADAKHIPVTDAMLQHFRQAGLKALLHYTARVGHTSVFNGRHLLLGGSTELKSVGESSYVGEISGIMSAHLPRWAEQHLFEPGFDITQLTDWSARMEAIVQHMRDRDITLLAGQPNWLLTLVEAILRPEDGQPRIASLQELWPRLECVIHSGVPLAPYADQLRQAAGTGVTFHDVYAASEGIIAAQEGESAAGLRLLTDCGLFFEFLPLADFTANRLESLGCKAVPLEGVQTNVDYVLLLTTPAGFCRYVLGDIVRFVSIAPPRIVYVGRSALHLTAFGEQVAEKEITEALTTVCQRHNWKIVNFHVAPYLGGAVPRSGRGRHEWWIELKPGTVETPTGPVIVQELDAELRRLSPRYEAKRSSGALEPPVARLVMPGVFEQWMRRTGRWGGQYKMPRCRSDRLVADELDQLAPYPAH